VPGAGIFPASPAPLTLSDMWRMIMCSKRWKPSSNAGGGGGGNRSTSSLFGLGCTAPAPELKMRYGFSLPQPSVDLSFIVSAPSPVSQAEAAVLQVGLFISCHLISSPLWCCEFCFPRNSCKFYMKILLACLASGNRTTPEPVCGTTQSHRTSSIFPTVWALRRGTWPRLLSSRGHLKTSPRRFSL
jgi:hypothetical protein